MNKTTKAILIITAIVTAAFGAWPISLLLLALYIILIAINEDKEKSSNKIIDELKKENQELKVENQKLRQELQDQAVRRAMDKAERQEKKD